MTSFPEYTIGKDMNVYWTLDGKRVSRESVREYADAVEKSLAFQSRMAGAALLNLLREFPFQSFLILIVVFSLVMVSLQGIFLDAANAQVRDLQGQLSRCMQGCTCKSVPYVPQQ